MVFQLAEHIIDQFRLGLQLLPTPILASSLPLVCLQMELRLKVLHLIGAAVLVVGLEDVLDGAIVVPEMLLYLAF